MIRLCKNTERFRLSNYNPLETKSHYLSQLIEARVIGHDYAHALYVMFS